jgi:urea transport system ATP-binding protein
MVETSQVILQSKNISVSFNGFKAIRNLDFQVVKNRVHFLIGPNGAGKTTLLDIICGKTPLSEGQVIFKNNYNLSKMKEYQIVRKGIGRKFQAPSIFSNLTVYENLLISMKQKKNLLATLKAVVTKDQETKILDMLKLIGLTAQQNQKAGVLAHGQKQWLEIAMVLLQEPELVLLDEPIAGMSKVERTKTGELIRQIAKERAVLIVEHDMDFVREFADVVTVMHGGQLLCEGSMEDVQNDPRVREVYLGKKEDKHVKTRAN